MDIPARKRVGPEKHQVLAGINQIFLCLPADVFWGPGGRFFFLGLPKLSSAAAVQF
jgi:hypothetical protein